MTREARIGQEGSVTTIAQHCDISVADVIRYFRGLAKLQDGKTGNPEFGVGLRYLAKALRPYERYLLVELADLIGPKSARVNLPKRAPKRIKPHLPPDLKNLQRHEIEEILHNEGYTKEQLAELGWHRFGISRPHLIRLRKEDAVDLIRSSVEHEKSLEVIGREAERVGRLRKS